MAGLLITSMSSKAGRELKVEYNERNILAGW
jgi:hypothetical protein